MRTRRTPFYGDPEDRALLRAEDLSPDAFWGDSAPMLPHDLTEPVTLAAGAENGSQNPDGSARTVSHPDYCEKGTTLALGFVPHQGENRVQRRAAVATWAPPEPPKPEDGSEPQRMPTRRELWEQRQKHRRGTLDPELRRLQRRKAKTK